MTEPVTAKLYEDGSLYYEQIVNALGSHITAGGQRPTVAVVHNAVWPSLVRQLNAKVEHGQSFSWFLMATPWAYLTVRHSDDVLRETKHDNHGYEWHTNHVRFEFGNFDRIKAYDTFELMERVATELMERAAKLRDALERTVSQ